MSLIDRAAAVAAIQSLPEVAPSPAPIASKIRRVATGGMLHEYSTMWPGDELHRALLLFHPGGYVGLHYQDDGRIYSLLPPDINHGSQPRWRRNNPDCFVYRYLNQLREFDCGKLTSRLIRSFDPFPDINGMGEGDLGADDGHIVLCSGSSVFIYEFSTDRIQNEFTAEAPFDSLYLAPTNQPLISYYGAPGIKILDQSGSMRLVAGKNGHMDVGRDRAGQPILVWCNSGDDTGPDRTAALQGCPNGIELRDLTGQAAPRCLLSLDWTLAVHIALPDIFRFPDANFVLVSTYDPKDPNSQVKYANENLQVMINGSGVASLGKHGADSATYEGKPRAAISPDGRRYLYDSRGEVYLGAI